MRTQSFAHDSIVHTVRVAPRCRPTGAFSAASIRFKNFDTKADNFFSISSNAVYEKRGGGGWGGAELLFSSLLHAAIAFTASDLPTFTTTGSHH